MMFNAFALCAAADSSEGVSVPEDSSTTVSDSENVADGFNSLTEFQQLMFLLSVLCGIFVGQAFSFWKW